MRKTCRSLAVAAIASAFVLAAADRTGAQGAQAPKPAAAAQAAKPAPAATPTKHWTMAAADLKWGPAPPGLPAGAEMAVVEGDPSKPLPFVIRAKFPDGYRVPPHWHPADENITVLSGTFLIGMGDTFNEAGMTTLTQGGFARMPKRMHHSALAKGATEIQLHGTGPFAITYVNPKDDPRRK